MQDGRDVALLELVDEFLAARATRKPSVHTLQAYRRDLVSIVELIGTTSCRPASR